MIMDNTDTDGLMSSILALTNGNYVDGAKGNYIMDPADRMQFDGRDDNANGHTNRSTFTICTLLQPSPTLGPTATTAEQSR